MATRLLIDAAHPEETRVVVVSGTRLDEFDFESSSRKQLKGNIYLAKVTRVEPSLQAAFVEYGGNRHGFLAFGDIHPDYYQIPVADRQALIKERAAEEAARGLAEEAAAEMQSDPAEGEDDSAAEPEAPETPETPESEDEPDPDNDEDEDDGDESADVKQPESVGGDDVEDIRPRRDVRRYKIQEVIKRRQVLLVQVVKEERGTKGAALTTYLSLAGRYGVLMPNTARGGGVSRKIANAKDRKRLRDIIDSLKVPDGVGLIVRTAGQQRTKADIRRDYDYLLRLWDTVRELTLQSTAPTLVYEEANLIKRAIRDLYSSDITEVLVEGEEGYKTAKGIMKMLMPSHAKRVQKYDDRIPLFHRYQVEQQLDLMHNPTVQLRSGGYIVLNSTEALVAIDVNSGRSTRERNIETTALKTNLEAAEEVARQLRLRDLAGLIVIDFIDMDVSRNNRAVERKLKESLKGDRARIQLGRISAFGLLELSRQRMRPSLIEASTEPCPTCGGTGFVRSTESAALHVMRVIEDEGIRGPAGLHVEVPASVAIYLLNQKRAALSDLEQRFGLGISILPDPDLIPPAHNIVREAREDAAPAPSVAPVAGEPIEERAAPEPAEPAEAAEPAAPEEAREAAEEAGEAKPTKRRRRGKRGGRRRRRKDEAAREAGSEIAQAAAESSAGEAASGESAPKESPPAEAAADEPEAAAPAEAGAEKSTPREKPKPKTRRRTRTRTRSKAKPKPEEASAAPTAPAAPAAEEAPAVAAAAKPNGGGAGPEKDESAKARKPRRRRTRKRKPEAEPASEPVASGPVAGEPAAKEPAPEKPAAAAPPAKPQPELEIPPAPVVPKPEEKPARRGWWQFGR